MFESFEHINQGTENSKEILGAMNDFFIIKKNNFGIFTCQPYIFAIFKDGNHFLMFDSHDLDAYGYPSYDKGTAVLCKEYTTKGLARRLMKQ